MTNKPLIPGEILTVTFGSESWKKFFELLSGETNSVPIYSDQNAEKINGSAAIGTPVMFLDQDTSLFSVYKVLYKDSVCYMHSLCLRKVNYEN